MTRRNRRGFTLVELMVGLAVGLFVSVIAISLFVSTRKLQTVNSASNRMAENARLAFDLLHKDLRLAGFRGCSDLYNRPPASVLNVGNGGFIDDASGLRGHRGNGAGFSPTLSAALSAVTPAPLNNSDIVSVRVPADALSLALATKVVDTGTPDVGTATNGNNLINAGDVVMMANCKNAILFQVTGAASPALTGLLPHAVGGGSPGNARPELCPAGVVPPACPTFNPADTALYRMQTRHYYVAPSAARPGTNSLWRLTVPTPAGAAQGWEEVVPGIDRLSIAYGLEIDAISDRAVDRYVAADGVTNWEDALTARIQMLAATTDNGSARVAQTVQFDGNAVVATDRRLREVFTEVVSFRNLMP